MRSPAGRLLLVLAGALGALPMATAVWGRAETGKLEVVHTLKGHNELVYSVAFHPEGKLLATGSFDRTVKLWDTASGKEVRTLQGPAAHQNIIMGVAFSPNGRILASCSTDNTIKFWDVPISGPLYTTAAPAAFHDAKLSPDGTVLATADADAQVRLWNAGTGKETAAFSGHTGPVKSVAFNANGQWVASGGDDRSVRVWNAANGQSLGVIPAAHAASVEAVAFHPNNQVLFTADAQGQVKFWPLPLPAAVQLAPAPTGAVKTVAATPDGKWIVAGDDQAVRVFETAKPNAGRVLPGPKAVVQTVTTNGTLIAAAFADHQVCLWSLDKGELIAQFSAHRFPITGLALPPSGQFLLSSSLDGSVKFWPLPIAGKSPQETAAKLMVSAHEKGVTAVVLHPDGKQFFTSGVEGTVKQWELPSGDLKRPFLDVKDAVHALALSREANPTRLAAACKDRTVRIWNLADGKQIASIPQPDEVYGLSFSPDNSKLATANVRGETVVWNLADAQPVQVFASMLPTRATAFVDAQTVAVCGNDKTVSLHKISVQRTLTPHKGAVAELTTTPNGSHLLTAGADGLVHMINTANGNVERTFKGHAGAVQAIALSRAGNVLFTGGADKTVRAFNIADAKELKAVPTPAAVQRLSVSPSQGLLAVGCADAQVLALSGTVTPGQPVPAEFGKILLQEKLLGPVTGLACHADNAAFTVLSASKLMTAFRITSEGPIRNLPGHANLIDAIGFSPDGSQMASCSHDGTIRFWDVAKGSQLASLNNGQPPQPTYCLAWSQDGKHLIVGGVSKELRLFDTAERKQLRECKAYDEKTNPKGHREAISAVAFSHDGKFFLSAGMDGQIKVWNTADGSFVRQLEDPTIKQPDGKSAERAHRDWINQIRFTPDGTRLISVGDGGWLTIWGFADGKPLFQQKFDTGLYSVALTADSKLMALGCRDHTALIVKVP